MRRKTSLSPLFYIALALLFVALIAGYMLSQDADHPEKEAASLEQEGPSANALPVQVQRVTIEKQRLWNEFSGRLAAVEEVDVRPQVGGTITKVLFDEGAIVPFDAPLFVIDPRPYEAAVANAKAALEAAKSEASLARVELERARKLVKDKFVSESRFDTNERTYKVAVANIESAKAQLVQAELDLEFAHVKSPIAGKVSRAEITVGNVIEAGANAPILTRIVSVDRIFAEFDVDEQTYVRVVRDSQGGGGDMPVELSLSGDSGVVYKGQIHSFDNQLNTTTGTIRARAMFDNVDGTLIPGMYVNVRLGSENEMDVMLITDLAIGTNQNQKYVYVVSEQNKVEYREIRLGQVVGNERLVISGLREGELIITNGLQRVRPGMEVTPKEQESAAEDASTQSDR